MRAILDHNLVILSNAYLFVCPVNLFERLTYLANCGVSADAVNDVRHGVSVTDAAVGADDWLLGSGVFQGFEPASQFLVVAALPQGLQFLGLALGDGLINVKRDR